MKIVTVSDDGGHTPLTMVQTKTVLPGLIPVIVELGARLFVMVPVPLNIVQDPEPIVGAFAFKRVDEAQMVWSAPALAVVGGALTITCTVSLEGVQTPLEIVHTNLLIPTPRPVTDVTGFVGVTTLPGPVITVQTPLPVTGVLPINVVEEEQIC